jgi:hypothetical protein
MLHRCTVALPSRYEKPILPHTQPAMLVVLLCQKRRPRHAQHPAVPQPGPMRCTPGKHQNIYCQGRCAATRQVWQPPTPCHRAQAPHLRHGRCPHCKLRNRQRPDQPCSGRTSSPDPERAGDSCQSPGRCACRSWQLQQRAQHRTACTPALPLSHPLTPPRHRAAPLARPARRGRSARLGRAIGGGALDLGPGRDDAGRQLLLHKAAAVGVLAEVALRAGPGARASAVCCSGAARI